MRVLIKEIKIKEGRRRLDSLHVRDLADSIRELGLLNLPTIDKDKVLIAGLHRLEAVKQLGWTEVECTVSSLEGLQAELAEIDENFVRNDLSTVEYSEMLLRRKEIYESLHPETRHGGDRKSGKIKCAKCTLEMAKSFVNDTAEKLKVDPCTVRRQLQTARNLTEETKEIMKNANTKFSKKAAMKLSRLEPEQQKKAATLLAAKEIKTVDEYTLKTERAELAGAQKGYMEKGGWKPEIESKNKEDDIGKKENAHTMCQEADMEQAQQAGEHETSLKELVADLKDPDKDCSGTPDSFLEEFAAFVRKFHREIAWYSDPYYDTVYPQMDGNQFAVLREMTQSICSAAEGILHRVERMMRT